MNTPSPVESGPGSSQLEQTSPPHNTVESSQPTVHRVVQHGTHTNSDMDVGKIDKTTIKQLRKNIERLKALTHVASMKNLPHYDINAFFKLGKK